MKNLKISVRLLTVAIAGIATVACNKIPHVDATSNEPNDLNIAHSNLNGENKVFSYNYICSSDTNELSIGGPLYSGIAKVQITNNEDSLIFEKNITSITAVDQVLWSEAGTWTVLVDFNNASGTFALSLSEK